MYQASHNAKFLLIPFFPVFGNVFYVSFKEKHFSLLPYGFFVLLQLFFHSRKNKCFPNGIFFHILLLHKKAREATKNLSTELSVIRLHWLDPIRLSLLSPDWRAHANSVSSDILTIHLCSYF